MPDERTFRRRRAVFGLLVVAALILLTGSYVGAFGGTERGFAGIASPIQEGASKVVKPVRDLVNWVGDSFRAKKDLATAQQQLTALRIANGQLVGKLSADSQRSALAQLSGESALNRYGPVSARMTFQSTSAWYRNIEIDKGTSNGVRERDPVVGNGGLIGSVIRAQAGSAVVRLITDPDSGVTSKVPNPRDMTGLRGTLSPNKVGSVGDMIIGIPKTSLVTAGNLVYTAGSISTALESRFPPDIPVGVVTSIKAANQDGQVVHVRALADLRRLDQLIVLTNPLAASP